MNAYLTRVEVFKVLRYLMLKKEEVIISKTFFFTVPEYKFVSIRLKKSEPSSKLPTDAHRVDRRDGTFSHKDIFITANSIFGHSVQMQLRRNDDLLAPSFKVSRIDDDDLETELKDRSYPLCYYLGNNGTISAAVSACEFSATKGLVSIQSFIKDLIPLKNYVTKFH